VFGCTNTDGTTPAGSWYRVFSLAEAGITNTFSVEKVTFGVCFAVGTPTVDVEIGTYAGSITDPTLDLAKITPVRSVNAVPVAADQISKLVDVPLTADFAPGTNIVVEISTKDFNGTGDQLSIGLTAAGETRAGFLRSPLCGPAVPMTTTAVGANAHFVITVTGTR